jgi:hypothetical protein
MTLFTADAYQNEYLPPDGSEVNAVITVTAMGPGADSRVASERSANAAEILIIDTSGSMGEPRGKMRAVREAAAVGIDCIRDGVAFGVIAGTDSAAAVYPANGVLVLASEKTRNGAKSAVQRLTPDGGTAIGSWLELADTMFATAPDGIRHAVLLTDGRNEHESPADLDRALARCKGAFQCDCRGVGSDWEVNELRRIASTLLGTVDIVAEPADLPADFRSMIESAMGKATANVSLRLWAPQGATVAFVRQVAPAIEDLTDRGTTVDPLTTDYPTGAWGDESRDYHVCVQVPPRGLGEQMLAARFGLVVDGQAVSQALIKATWTDDEQLSMRINREVAHYSGQAELAEAIQAGLNARKAGDTAKATMKLGIAVRLAAEGGNEATMKLLERVVDVDDAATGTVRLRRDVADVDEMALGTRSTKTVRVEAGSS